MTEALASINQSFERNYRSIFQKPELVQTYLHQRSKEFDRMIKKEFLQRKLDTDFALVALGGYGRKELFPSSDIDISIIQLKTKTLKVEEIKDFIGWLWTLKVKIGHSVRTIKDIEKIARSDLKEFTSYLSYRIIYCKPNHINGLNQGLQKISIKWSKNRFFKHKKLEQLDRFQSFNSTEFSLEPDLKESPGCLRDFQTALWILEHCFGLNKLSDCVDANLFSRKDVANINRSYSHIKTLRFALNLHSTSNRISFENQLLLAKKSKLRSSKKSSDVEKFMRLFFLHAAKLSDFNEMVFQAYEDQLSILKRPYTKNFYIFKDRLGINNQVNLIKSPEIILDSFIQIGRLKKVNGLDFKSIQKIQKSLPKINPEYFLNQKAGSQFLQILASPNNLSTILKKLKQLGLMKRLIPEFGEIEGQMQFDMFHVYTVDEHTFKVVRSMRQMQIGKIDDSLKIEHELINKLSKIELLYLAGIFHDLGKGKGGDHSEIGAKIVTKFCKRLKLSIHDTELLAWLVQNHLVMSSMSQKTDVHDPQTILDFTKNVNSLEKLNYIYMLTINDIRGTNPTLWNSWKHDLLKQLFLSSRRKLNLEETQSSQLIVQERKETSLKTIPKKNSEHVIKIWSQLPDTYFSKYRLKQLSNQAKAISNSNKETTVLVNSGKNVIEIFIHTLNQSGLFFKTARIFEQLSLETIDSNIHTTNDGQYAMNTFICKHKVLGSNLIQRDVQNIEQKIISEISASTLTETSKPKKQNRKIFQHATRIAISATPSQDASLITLETLDQPALLSKVANIFLDHGVSIISARITTLGEKVEDNFTVIDGKTKSKISENKSNLISKKLKNL